MDYKLAIRCLRDFMDEGGKQELKGAPDPASPYIPWISVTSSGDGAAHLEATNEWYADATTPEMLFKALESAFIKVFGSIEDLDRFIGWLCPDSTFDVDSQEY